MTTNAKMIVFSIVCLIASIAFLILWRRKEDHTRTDILQNVFNIPLSVITAGGLIPCIYYSFHLIYTFFLF